MLGLDGPLEAGPVRPANRFCEAGKERLMAVPGSIDGAIRRMARAISIATISIGPRRIGPRA